MRVAGEIVLDAPRAELWERLSEPVRLARALPGVERVTTDTRDGSLAARVRPVTGLGATPFDLRLWVRDEREHEEVTVDGEGRGAESAVSFSVVLGFRDRGEGTAVSWSARAAFLGVLGSLGQRVLPALVNEQIEGVLRAAASLDSGRLSR